MKNNTLDKLNKCRKFEWKGPDYTLVRKDTLLEPLSGREGND